ncbi:MAG: D-arabinose 5-phosphate isomerase [Acidobacteria bacterium 13_1_40CM_65_14]|nr:MAG: D-arabinose 5-phosphate isomerase [Acidobacteria bacterium 13_1_40CM_65_14]OLC79227.1 MAG: D-arabinose 5-phosphate isomerase [Acidobacteria bacterium 13_1_40CM_4_65_8]OLE82849.1 MAG: D-arabinose 5-phosphate isomerase [Acidobacteria bacterium 13_1_20CM_2_65_9]
MRSRSSQRFHFVADHALARKVLETEAAAILALVDRLDGKFDCAIQLLRQCKGRVILTGMGKSGIICQKIAATLNSTGTASIFLHPAEAMHGDLGVIQSDDVVIALSYSGETDELLGLLETIRRLGAKLIAITGGPRSTLAQAADVALDCSVTEEACPMNLVPTASTTAALAIGDALAMTLCVAKGFKQEEFANLHPGGKLGKRLMRVEALMHAGSKCPIVHADTRMRDVIYEMSSKGLGMTCVVAGPEGPEGPSSDAVLLGIITDGDLRRHMERGAGILDMKAGDVMTRNPVAVPRSTLAAEALNLMEQRKITSIVVADGDSPKRVAGVVHLHDLWHGNVFD